jgi:hypothetical protein
MHKQYLELYTANPNIAPIGVRGLAATIKGILAPLMNHRPFILLAALALGSCASLSESECQDADWERIGEADGDIGRPATHIEQHIEACGRYGIEPDIRAYSTGHAGGLDDYCTVRGGLETGRRGRSYKNICKPGFEEDFLQGFRLGRQIYTAETEVDDIEQTIRSYELELSSIAGTDSTQRQNYRRRLIIDLTRLRQRHASAENDLIHLQRKAQEMLTEQ